MRLCRLAIMLLAALLGLTWRGAFVIGAPPEGVLGACWHPGLRVAGRGRHPCGGAGARRHAEAGRFRRGLASWHPLLRRAAEPEDDKVDAARSKDDPAALTSAASAPAVASPIPRSLARGLALQLVFGGGYLALLYSLLTAENNPLYRSKVQETIGAAVPRAGLRVLEVGIGSAPNLEFYPSGTRLVGLDANPPDLETRRGIDARAQQLGINLRWRRGSAQQLPFEDGAFDAVIMTKVLCSVGDPAAALREVSRVLASGGRFGYVEHVAADAGSLLEQQQLFMDPLQQAIAGNCHLHRATDALVHDSVRGATAGQEALFSQEEAAERYQVWQMWPIAQQAAGVVTK